jgi:hypothetical protein
LGRVSRNVKINSRVKEEIAKNAVVLYTFIGPKNAAAKSSVADPRHFGVDPDPDPRIHASD